MSVRWGIMGAAGIARKKFLPAAKEVGNATVAAIASRSIEKGRLLADQFGIPKVYGSYAELLDDTSVDAVYIPLPNAQHVDATLKALRKGKHVLCEKPIALTAEEICQIAEEAAKSERRAVEGFMVAYHPQWEAVRKWISEGHIGSVQYVEGTFTYYLDNPDNIRNRADGGALRDIGVYPVFVTRLISGKEPRRVLARMQADETCDADIDTRAWLEFDGFHASFYVSARADRSERFTVFGTHGRIEVPNAYNPPDKGEQNIYLFQGNVLKDTKTFSDCFQFARQIEHLGEVFSGQATQLVTLENSAANQRVLDAIRRSSQTRHWEDVVRNDGAK